MRPGRLGLLVTSSSSGRRRRSTITRSGRADLPVIAPGSRAPITTRFDPTALFQPGQRLRLGVEPGRVHVFDARSGLALATPAAG